MENFLRGIDFNEAMKLIDEGFQDKIMQSIGGSPHRYLWSSSCKDVLEMMNKLVDEVPNSYFGDPLMNYICLFSDEIGDEGFPMKDKLIEELGRFKNVTPKPHVGAYFPDKQTLYFMPDVDFHPIRFKHYPYSDHFRKEEEKHGRDKK